MARSDQSVARTDSVRLKLSPDMVARLGRLAEAYGMPLSTLGALALGEWVVSKEANVRLAREAVLGIGAQIGGELQRVLSGFADSPEFERLSNQAASSMSVHSEGSNGVSTT